MKVVDNLEDIRLYIEYMLCFNFKDLKNQRYVAGSFDASKFRDEDIVVTLFDDYRYKMKYSKLKSNSKGQHIDIFGFRYYLNKDELVKIKEAINEGLD